MFVDKAKITIISGKGGNGAVSFRREPYVPEGGPDGGDGGKGGDVIFVADRNLRTLMDFRYKRKYEAESGQDGMKKNRYGKQGNNLEIRVPVGTMIMDEETGLLMKDLKEDGDSLIAARGGKGGKGNVHFKNPVRQAPNFAEAGGFAQKRNVVLELKLLADVGLVGFPNVGKSTILSIATSARPKIANYHFTTIDPNLGVVRLHDSSFVMADIAGIIEGAHMGLGLGFMFLKHIERTKVLIHVIDVSGSEGRDPIDDFEKINNELKEYNEKILNKPQIIAANKMDLLGDDDTKYEELKAYVSSKGYEIFPISAATGAGLNDLLNEAANKLNNISPDYEEPIELFDFDKDNLDDEYKRINCYYDEKDKVYILDGKQLIKIFNSTNFNDMGSLRYLYKYIEKKGAIEKLKEIGLKDGDTVRIENYEFEYFDD